MIIGIYGTIGSGKTTISERFRQLNFRIINCDQLAREILSSKQFQKTLKNLFPQCFDGGEFNRSKMRSLISKDENERLKLNSIVWPEMKNQIITIMTLNPSNYVIDGALLPELNLNIDYYIEVSSTFLTAAYRVMRRDKKPKKETLAIYLKQKKALKKFSKMNKMTINNNFWNRKMSVKQLKKILIKWK